MTEIVRALLSRATLYRAYARSFSNRTTRLALRGMAAKLEERARQMKLARRAVGQAKPQV